MHAGLLSSTQGESDFATAIAAQLRDTQQMTLLLADAGDFSTFFAKQVNIWGQVVRENNIRA